MASCGSNARFYWKYYDVYRRSRSGLPGAWILANGSGLSLQIGGNPQAANRGWDGNIDDVALWDRALTTEEVALIWNDGAGASVASLTATGSSGLFQGVDVKYSRTEDNLINRKA